MDGSTSLSGSSTAWEVQTDCCPSHEKEICSDFGMEGCVLKHERNDNGQLGTDLLWNSRSMPRLRSWIWDTGKK